MEIAGNNLDYLFFPVGVAQQNILQALQWDIPLSIQQNMYCGCETIVEQ